MNSIGVRRFGILAGLLAWTLSSSAAERPRPEATTGGTNTTAGGTNAPAGGKGDGKKEEAKPSASTIPDATNKPVLTTNAVSIDGERITYVTETGMLPLLKNDGTTRASVFYIAYTKQGETNLSQRPITFSFNGGPGSSSVWLHLGALGPRRVKMNSDGTLPKPPFGLVDNDYSILNVTDLVFIDPVATGFSRVAKDSKPEEFFGQAADVESVGDFIRLWTTRHERWLSAKYLCGESYGVFRAAGLANYLHSRYGMYLNGLMLVSGVLDFATLGGGPGNDLPALTFLPAFTVTAQYHKKLPPDLQADPAKARAEAREFIKSEYPAALLQGKALPAAQRSNIVAKLVRLTGLPARVIEENDLQINSSLFRKMLLHDEGLIIGRYDARITGRDDSPGDSFPAFDPSYAATLGPFSAAMNSYVRQELKFEDDLPYEILTGVQPWNFDARNSYPSVSARLASVMNQNPYLRVLVLGSLYDLACPIDGIHYSIDHMQLDSAYRANIIYAEYNSGHMMYVNLPDLQKLQKDLTAFIRQ
jgi:carboxypeptidase C (cathepsin A)